MYYIIKSPNEADTTITISRYIQNKFAICSSDAFPTQYPNAIEFIEPYYSNMYLYDFANGKRQKVDIFPGKVNMIPVENSRVVIDYSADQLLAKLELHAWIALNVFAEEKLRLGLITPDAKNALVDEINAINNTDTICEFIKTNLYYDL